MIFTKPKINANIAKTMLMSYFLYKRNHCLVLPEVDLNAGVADIITINKAGFSYEVEIKTDKYDLLKEIRVINEILSGETPCREYFEKKNSAKYRKHDSYKVGFYISELAPKYYYIAIPAELLDLTKDKLMNKSYGIMLLDLRVYNDNIKRATVSVVRRAKPLHNKKVDFEKLKEKFFYKLSFMNLNLMRKLYLEEVT